MTGMYDDDIARSRSMSADLHTVYTEAAHIVPFSVGNAPVSVSFTMLTNHKLIVCKSGTSKHIWSAFNRYFPRLRSILLFLYLSIY